MPGPAVRLSVWRIRCSSDRPPATTRPESSPSRPPTAPRWRARKALSPLVGILVELDPKAGQRHGTLMWLKVECLPGDRDSKPVWLWSSAASATPADVDRWWQSFLRRFGLEHMFRLMKQTLGRAAPKIHHADTADLRICLIIAAHTQLQLARPSPRTSAVPGNAAPDPLPHAGQSAPRVSQPPRRDCETGGRTETHMGQTLDGPPARRTGTGPSVTTSAGRSNAHS